MRETSKRRLRATGYAALLLTMGAVLGPMAVAVISASFPEKRDANGWPIEAMKLVEVFQSRPNPRTFRLMLTMEMPPNGQECGYRDDKIFGQGYVEKWAEAIRNPAYTPYEGYNIILHWKSQGAAENYKENMAMWIDDHIPTLEIAFLRRCIEYTVLSGFCYDRVASRVATIEFSKIADTSRGDVVHANEILCTFIDGIAARKGLPLASLDARDPNWKWGKEPPK